MIGGARDVQIIIILHMIIEVRPKDIGVILEDWQDKGSLPSNSYMDQMVMVLGHGIGGDVIQP